jgi:hypothetical protein
MIIDVLCPSCEYETLTQHVDNYGRSDEGDHGGGDVVDKRQIIPPVAN